MRKMKTIALILLAFTMIFVTACNSSDSTEENTETGTETETTVTEEEPVAEIKEEEVTIDMNGETIKILLWYGEPVAGTQEGDLILARQKEVEEKYNTKIEWVKVPWGQPIEMITNAALAGESITDILALDRYHSIPAITQGLLLPVDGMFDFDEPKWPKGIKEFGSWEGKMYGFTERVTGSTGLYYNKTLFEREGLPDPHELIAQDKWNWDSFLDIAKRATKDLDGDGITDQWGMKNDTGNLARLLVYGNEGKYMDQKDGKWVFTHDDPNTLEALHFLSDLYNVHKVNAPNKFEADYAESQTMFSTGKTAMVTGELWEGAERKNMTDEQGFVPFPKGPKAKDYSNTVENFIMWFMPANAKHPKEVAQIWQELILWDRIEKVKKEDAEKQRLADEKDVKVMMEITDFVQPLYIPTGGALGGAIRSILEGEAPESALEKVKQTAQDGLDKGLNTKNQ